MRDLIVAIVGPTAVGKTYLSLEVARRFNVEIVSVDSRQIYQHLDIGTAKPTIEDRSVVSHHLIDIADPKDGFSLATYLKMARSVIGAIHKRGAIPLLVGGTGQYFRALVENWQVPAVAPDWAFREKMETFLFDHGTEALYERLKVIDPISALAIDPKNSRRVIRALEVYEHTGASLSKLRSRSDSRYTSLVLGVTTEREKLDSWIDLRVDNMIGLGWVQEVSNLLGLGVNGEHQSMSSVGYRELVEYLRGNTELSEAIQNIKTKTRRFARSQYGWFSLSNPSIKWLESEGEVVDRTVQLMKNFMC
jgi:tRNA dimethylallyltransferase